MMKHNYYSNIPFYLNLEDRRMKELAMQIDEERKQHEKFHDIIEKLHHKLKNYKHHVDEAVSTSHFYIFDV